MWKVSNKFVCILYTFAKHTDFIFQEKFSVAAQPAEDHVRILGQVVLQYYNFLLMEVWWLLLEHPFSLGVLIDIHIWLVIRCSSFPVQIVDGAHVNVDVTAPGGTIALALIFMKVKFIEDIFPNCAYLFFLPFGIHQNALMDHLNLTCFLQNYRQNQKKLCLDSVFPLVTMICSMLGLTSSCFVSLRVIWLCGASNVPYLFTIYISTCHVFVVNKLLAFSACNHLLTGLSLKFLISSD